MLINGEEHNDLCVGIDLGTTNSVLATVNIKPNGDAVSKVIDIPRAVDSYSVGTGTKFQMKKMPTIPSCVYYNEAENFQPYVGDFAKTRYSLRPYLVAKSIKSQMGNPEAEGLSQDIPDKSPAQISARILEHMLHGAEKICRTKIDDAVITVPANFDSLMCQATRDAASLAGIKTHNRDGSERPILLSEPNAVIYDFINQVKNGEVSSHILDLSAPRHVMVFDLGGGTLDITLHEIMQRADYQDVLKIDEIATNRYTLLGGDDFDRKIAEAMFKRYTEAYRMHPDVVAKLRREEKTVMPQLLAYAEALKIDLSSRHSDDFVSSGWDDDDDEEVFDVGGNISSTGYAYDDSFTSREIEEILSPFMGETLRYEDYKDLDRAASKGTNNIIFPILDVLKKASQKLGSEDVHVDAVLMNGGMSRFYMVSDRLKEFFGMDPIVALDPDQAVARGAAVYHHYLHQYEALRDDMRMVGIRTTVERNEAARGKTAPAEKDSDKFPVPPIPKSAPRLTAEAYKKIGIEIGQSILNDSLYLGTRNASQTEIIPTGAALPYTSELMTGFGLTPGTDRIAIPIKSRNLDGTYRTIARGNIVFKQQYKNGAYIAFIIYMSTNKVITMQAWTCNDCAGKQRIEEGSTSISIGDGTEVGKRIAMVAPQAGAELDAVAEIRTLEQLCRNFSGTKNHKKGNAQRVAKEIRAVTDSIRNAGNHNDFAGPLLKALSRSWDEEFKQRCFVLARYIGKNWTAEEKNTLATLCMQELQAELQGVSMFLGAGGNSGTNTKIQAIYTLYMCAQEKQLQELKKLHDYPRFLEACLYTHAKTKTCVDWIFECFKQDCKKAADGYTNNIQNSAYAMGIAFLNDGRPTAVKAKKADVIEMLCRTMLSRGVKADEAITCILALGIMCDQRTENELPQEIVNSAWDVLDELSQMYSYLDYQKVLPISKVVRKMLEGAELMRDEEMFLLTKLER